MRVKVVRPSHVKIPRDLRVGGRIGDRDLGGICLKELFEAVVKVETSRKLEQGKKAKDTMMSKV